LLGHRRIILAAIRTLGSDPAGQSNTVEVKPQNTAERLQVTVMFSDLVARRLLVPEGCTTAGRLAGPRYLLAVIGAGGGTKFPISAELLAIRSLFDAAIPSIGLT